MDGLQYRRLKDTQSHELRVVVQAVAPTAEMAEETCMTGTRQMFYARLPDVKETAGSVSFFLDEVLRASPAYHWRRNHTVAVVSSSAATRPSGSPGDPDIFGAQNSTPP